MKAIDLLTKLINITLDEKLSDYENYPSKDAINSEDYCLDDIIFQDKLTSFFRVVKNLSRLKGRTVKNVTFNVIDDKDCAIDGSIGFFRIELEPK